MAERGCPLEAVPLPAEVRESLAELELELSEGDITQKGYEKKRAKLLARCVPLIQGVDPSLQVENSILGPAQASAPAPKQPKPRPSNARDERFRSDVHTEAVQAALAKYKERKMPMPSKRRSVLTHTSVEAYTPPDTSSASEDEGSLQRPGRLASAPLQSRPSVEPWPDPAIQGSSTSSSASSTSSHPGGQPAATPSAAAALAGPAALARVDLHSAPPDVTTGLVQHQHAYCERPQMASVRGVPRGCRGSVLETAGGVPVNSRVSSKIQQLLNTLKRPKRPPLKEFFVDDFEELLEVQQPDPNQPKPEGSQMAVLRGEPLAEGSWPPSLLAALQQWGTTQPRAPCLTALDTAGKAVYTLTYGKLWSRSLKLAYTLLNKLTNKNEPLLKPGDRVALVFPNSDPVMFMVAFYGCLLAEVVPVPIEVPLTRKDAGSQQVGFLLGSCGVSLALTTDACQKGLPKAQTGEVVTFKGWPPLTWLVIDGKHLTKPPKDWHPAMQDAGPQTAYIEYKTSKEGSTVGVAVSHVSLLAQCQALTQACGYSEAETLTNVLDFKRDAGLWHGVLTSILNRLHVVSIPYALMKANPLSWIQKVCVYKAQAALVKSRDMHWSLLAQRGQRDVSLSSLRLLIVADGANPWSISSCDAFLNVFQARGLRPEVICPCASSPEALTVAIRRPPDLGGPPPRRAVLSMSGLSHGVIRVDAEEKLSVLTVQDVGQVMPGANVCVVKVEGTPHLCKTDEVGEICVDSSATATAYYGLLGITKNVFETVPVTAGGAPVSDRPFTRTGLLGFIGPDDLVFVVGKLDGLMVVGFRRHNADDVVATALAVEPMKFVYRGRIAVFSVTVLHDDRIVLVAEQRPDASEEDSFQWMSRVLQAIDSIHQVGVYCLALVPANTLPKAPLGGIHVSEAKQRFLEGMLHPCNVLMCPHACVTNLPKPRQKQPEVGPASMIVGNLVAGKRIAQASGRELSHLEDSEQARKFLFLPDVLQWRAHTTPEHPLFLLLNAKGTVTSTATCVQLHKKAERVAAALMEKARLSAGAHVALVYPPGVDLIAAFYGCLYCGCVPVTVRPPHPQNLATTLPTVKMIVEVSKSACVLTTQAIMRLLRSKEAAATVDARTWPTILDTDDIPKKKVASIFRPPSPDVLAYLDFSVSTTGILAGVKMSHAATSALCRSIKLQCELYPSRQIAICLDPYCGLGFALWCLCSVYSGHQSVLVPPPELETNVSLWLWAVSQYKARVTFCSYSVMEMCARGLGAQTAALRMKGVNLSCVRTCMVVAEERPRIALTQSFSKLFRDLGLPARAVSTTFGCRVNVAICLQGTAGPDPTTVYVDMRALRHDRVRLVERGSPHSLPLTESGKILPGVKVIIAHTETRGPLGDPGDCLFASQSGSHSPDVQMLDVYSLIPFDNPDGGVWKQGFDITYKPDEWDTKPLQVFVVPHSHNDPGWLKTFDDYFREKTQYIFNNMVVKLKEDPRRKFIWSEISYLSKWWETIDVQKKDAVKSLLENGQFEIVTGGWVMPDEAGAHYFAIIDQLIEGHQWLETNLGVKPRSGWAIDPFGHSPTMAYLLKRAGFSHMLIQRVHYAVKKHFALHKTLEFFWRQNWDLGSATDILCHMMPFYSYDIPHTCGPDPKICCQFDFKRLPGGRYGCPWGVPPETIYPGNLQNRAEMLLDQYRKKSKLFRTTVVLAPLGDDFRYTERTEWDHQFKNYQLLFDYMNSHPQYNVKIQFGTLSDYFDALEKEASANSRNSQSIFPVLSGDFFTYADRDDHYWSGYFTSRPFYKRMDRTLESHLRAAEILYYFALKQAKQYKISKFLSSSHYVMLTEARRNLGLFQHHDAITGTAKDWVVVDYGTRLFHSLMNLKKVIGHSALLLILKDKHLYDSYSSDTFLEMDLKQRTQSSLPQKHVISLSAEPRYLVVYNPLEQARSSVVSVCVSSPAAQVSSASGEPVEIQMSAVWDTANTASQTVYEISFLAEMPPLGLKVYKILETSSSSPHLAKYDLYNGNIANEGIFNMNNIKSAQEAITLENSFIKLRFGQSGLLEEMINKGDGKSLEVRVQFSWYGTTSKKDKSGAYLFLPDGEAKPYVYTTPPFVRVQRGRFYSDVTCFFEHVTHRVRLYNIHGVEGQSVEISNIVDIRKEHNYEIAMRISSGINSQNRFYTDLNGYQIQPRVTMSKLPLQANVYPMTTMAYIQDAERRLTLLSAQSLGVSSLKSGQIEVIMDRRLMQDDNRGLEQGVHDNKITANLFRILLEERSVNMEEDQKAVSYPSLLSHITSSFLNHPVFPMTEKAPVPALQLLGGFSPLMSPLPCDIHLVNLRTVQSKVDGKHSSEAALILHRKGFDCRFSSRDPGLLCSTTQGKILVQKLFSTFTVVSIIPSSLSLMHSPPDARNISEINLSPMEISAFRIRLR